MKNNDIQETEPVYNQEKYHTTNNETTLVDLAAILYQRKKMIALTAIFIIAIGAIAAALPTPKLYNFTTSLEIGSQIIGGTIKPFESPQTLLAKIHHVYIPKTLNKQRQTNPEIKYKIKASIPKNSVIIVLTMKGADDNTDLITSILQEVTQQAIQDHDRIYTTVKENLLALKNLSQTELISLGSSRDNLAIKRQLLQGDIEVRESQLANLRNTREILPPMQSIQSTNTNKSLIVIVAVISGLFLGVFLAFFAEFIDKVKEKTKRSIQLTE